MCLAVVHQDPDHDSNQLGAYTGGIFNDADAGVYGSTGAIEGSVWTPSLGVVTGVGYGQKRIWRIEDAPGRRNLLSEDDIDGMCSGKLGMAHCSHPGSYWYNTGGNLLSALCWDQGTPTAMSVDETCTGMNVLNTTMTGDLTTSETFMLLGSN